MFVLVEMKDTVRISPWSFHVKQKDAITEAINKKLGNKVVPDVGLCIALWDIIKLDESFILPGDGASHTNVHFRYVVFRPFMDEVLTGTIKSCNKEGVQVSIDFFDDILIPAHALQHPSRFDETEQLWSWTYQAEGETHDLYMDVGETIRLRVVDEQFVDTSPTGPEQQNAETEDDGKSKVPYSLTASISEPGLGLLSWWNS